MTVGNAYAAGSFVLLGDFWDGYRLLEARHVSAEVFIRDQIQVAMHKALMETMPRLTVLSIEELRQQAHNAIEPDEFIVTLDGGILFPAADFRIEVTRAADSVQNSITGQYVRVARGLAPQLVQQTATLRNVFRKSSKRRLTLCDDGIGTGETIKRILSLLEQLDLKIQRIIAITNPRNLLEIDGIPVTTIHPMSEEFIWLNERDLYWGLPRSGLSIFHANRFVAVGGVPYTLSDLMVQKRIGLPSDAIPTFRQANLKLNKSFWAYLESLWGRSLTLKDCTRLQFLGDELKQPDLPIVELIARAESGQLLKELKLQ